METDLIITTEQAQGKKNVTILHLQGWLDAKNEERFFQAGRAAYEAGARYLILDLGEVETLTSAGMRAIQKVYKLFTPADEHFKVSHIKLCNVPPQIHNILGITGFLQNIPSYATMQSALSSFDG